MGSEATRDQAFATNYIKGNDWAYLPGCGGRGAAGCSNPATYSYLYWTIKPSKYAVRNRHLVLQDMSFLPYTDAGPNGLGCSHSDGSQVGFKVYLLHSIPGDLNFAAHATSSKTISNSISLPFYLNWDSPILIPQQNNVNWTGYIYVVLDFGATGYMTGVPQNYEAFQTVNLDFDQRV